MTDTRSRSSERAITLGDLRGLVYLTGRDAVRSADMFGEGHLFAKDAATPGYRREVFLTLGPASESLPRGAS